MRLNANSHLRFMVNVYLNGEKEPNAVEVYIPGNVLEGRGYVVRSVTNNGKQVATIDVSGPLSAGRYDYEGALCEKVFGQVRIEIDEEKPLFEDN